MTLQGPFVVYGVDENGAGCFEVMDSQWSAAETANIIRDAGGDVLWDTLANAHADMRANSEDGVPH